MRFLVDAQLPRRLAHFLNTRGHDALHTLDLPSGNATTDWAVAEIADADDRVVVTKDADFVVDHLARGRPARLLLVAVGNASNARLLAIFDRHLDAIVAALDESRFVELHADRLLCRPG